MLNLVTLLHYSALLANQVYCSHITPESISSVMYTDRNCVIKLSDLYRPIVPESSATGICT